MGVVNLFVSIGANAAAVWVAAWLITGISVSGPEGREGWPTQVVSLLVVGAIMGAINAVIKPIIKLLSLPVLILTLGLFTFIVNAIMLQITSWVVNQTPLSFTIESFFWDAILGAIVISIVSMVLNTVFARGD